MTKIIVSVGICHDPACHMLFRIYGSKEEIKFCPRCGERENIETEELNPIDIEEVFNDLRLRALKS
jgi:rRNA maturation endonuclease Nob1